MKKTATSSEWLLYLKTGLFGMLVFGACYGYLKWLGIPGELNKSAADTAILLMGLSMIISSICYFWNALDWTIVYRKYLGLIGLAFGVVHFGLSWQPFLSLLKVETWQKGSMWPLFTGALALVIFVAMALVSNSFAARKLGGKVWRYMLRAGYVAVLLVLAHVVLLKSARWFTWYQGGMKTPPSLSLLVSIFMVIVLLLRLNLWFASSRAARKK